ncbi:phosphoglycerate mutase-like protein 4 [Cyclospora cayetanensis]|uniref:Phosphoglycerate mutase-like protein 4 n=1 Tax=Cyclospora cayetanensis TaxID=88456 RepID=A0A6P6RUK8_9EIME|nr:phosphoglycerate mutase-like protein 4 [Cyclospora cayetanensis]
MAAHLACAAELNYCCEVFAIRHGLTDYNAERRLQGQLDVPLNDIGREQCRECGKKLKSMIESGKNFQIEVIYSSPLNRTRESAEIIRQAAGIDCKIVLDGRIQEWNAGILQGHLLDELPVLFPKEWGAWNRSRDPGFVFPRGESFQQRYNRVKEFFLEVTARHTRQRIIVVTHGGVLDDLFRLVRNIPMNIKTNAPKLNAELHIVKAHTSKARTMPLMAEDNPSEDCWNDSPSASLTTSLTEAHPSESPEITWEIVRWGKMSKNDQRLAGKLEETPIDISLRAIEYA